MKKLSFWIVFVFLMACQSVNQNTDSKAAQKMVIPEWVSYDESAQLLVNENHENPRMRYKLIQSKSLDKNKIWKKIEGQLDNFSETDYERLKPLILEQEILTLQNHIATGKLTYEQLTQWYLFRILKFENNPETTLHSIIDLNPEAVALARICDQQRTHKEHPIFGIPILVKDNINTKGMKTTAGAEVLIDNQTEDAFIIQQIKNKGGIILGKANLSEWAYFFCEGCPVGYSAVGGQTLNPYGRHVFETGGSSAGSGTTMAANYAAAAIGTETAGSILSPSSQNSVVGLKPTIGLLSRSGIVPISSTLDTPGPMTRSVQDNAILLSAMFGKDSADPATSRNPLLEIDGAAIKTADLKRLRLGVNEDFLSDSIYNLTVDRLKAAGATLIKFKPSEISFPDFVTFLNADMKQDLPAYLNSAVGSAVTVRSIADVVEFNLKDTLNRIPYGQGYFEGIVAEDISEADFTKMKKEYKTKAAAYFTGPMEKYNLDAILSINNYSAGQAAMAQFPCLTVPMGYKEIGEPISLTFIAKPWEEMKLLEMGSAFEQLTKVRKMPKGYR